MSFLAPNLPDFDVAEWRQKPHLERIRPLVQHWVENGFGVPTAVYLLYVFKVSFFAIGGAALISLTTPGLGGLTHVREWWDQPIVFQKAIVLLLLLEVLGLAGASGPLTVRFDPPVGGFLYWLRPGTIRRPPWPDKVPLTAGSRRSLVDVALYAGLIFSAVRLVVASPTTAGLLSTHMLLPLAVLLPLLGLRDKTIFLAARAEQYWLTTLLFFFPLTQMLAAAKVVMVALWFWAAVSKINRHAAFVMVVMLSNSPLLLSKRLKRALYRDYPNDLNPSTLGRSVAKAATCVELLVPLVLITSRGGTVTTVALAVIVVFHLGIIAAVPMGVPLEWNIFFIFGSLFLFGAHAGISPLEIHSPLLVALLLVAVVGVPVLGMIRPDKISFLPAMRYYAGNWATTLWCFKKGAEDKLDTDITKVAPILGRQLEKLYGAELSELMQQKGLAWRSMHLHGRALNGLLPRALDDVEDYDVREGEFVCGVLLGWNFGDGHLHDEQLVDVVQGHCHFGPGDLRVIVLESEPFRSGIQRYRIVDAATGPIEQGEVLVDDMYVRQPWLDATCAIPVSNVTRTAGNGPTGAADQRARSLETSA